ncbi:MAG: glutamine amidotransferase [Frankiales bacterium]|nr:glutamine amidotransferase [Frankiales bacterium]
MSGPRIGVLALQGDVREHVRALTRVGAEPVQVRRPEELADIDGLVLPGGESTTIGKLLDLFELLEPLRAAVKTGLPVYGSCAGMILLADEVLDGRPDQATVGGLDIAVRRNAFGRQVDSFETDLPLAGVGDVHAVFIRAPWVERTGPGVEVLATVGTGIESGAAAGKVVAVRRGPLLATSFHPELTGDDRVHGFFVQMVKEASS